MATQAGEIEHDSSWVNFYRLYKLHKPDGTVNEFKKWMESLGELQKTIKECPWCKGLPALRVHPSDEQLVYGVGCENDFCSVNPELNEVFDNPEEAILEWNNV